MDERLIFSGENGETAEMTVLAQVRMSGCDYLLAAAEEEEEAEALILKDISGPEDAEAQYVIVEDDDELRALIPLFEEELDDIGIDIEQE